MGAIDEGWEVRWEEDEKAPRFETDRDLLWGFSF